MGSTTPSHASTKEKKGDCSLRNLVDEGSRFTRDILDKCYPPAELQRGRIKSQTKKGDFGSDNSGLCQQYCLFLLVYFFLLKVRGLGF